MLSVLQCPIIMGSDFTKTEPLEVIFRSNREYHPCVTALVEANLMAFHEGPGHVKGHPGEDRKSLVIFHVIDVYWCLDPTSLPEVIDGLRVPKCLFMTKNGVTFFSLVENVG